MYRLLTIFIFIIFSCYQKKEESNKTTIKIANISLDKQIHVTFKNIEENYPSFFYFNDYDEQFPIISKKGVVEDIEWDNTNTLSLLTTAFNATYPIFTGDSTNINSIEKKGYLLSIPNSRFNNFEINFFSFLSKSNQNILDYYYRKLMKMPSFPITGSIVETYNKSLSILDSCLSVGIIRKEYYNWAAPILKFEFNKCSLNFALQMGSEKSKIDTNFDYNMKTFFGRTYMQHNLIIHDLKSSFAKVDFNKAYNFVKNSYKDSSKDYLLFFITKQLIEKNLGKKEQFVSNFKNDVKNSFYNIYFEQNYSNTSNTKEKVGSIIFINKDKKEINFDTILNKNKGYLLYIDNWASWCAPCRVEMQSTKDLAEFYKGKKIKIIYLSIDEKVTDWTTAINQLDIGKNENCYLLKNPRTTLYTKSHKITEIPRYLLFDKNGKVINENAPLPSSIELKKLIDENL